ncbi:Coenzyme A synthase, isoform CRA_b [Rattus norvegicus]|uniref:Coenzyme A synthase, isoform CRA_b n=1 Tax=Rattus norvegicus TaxID=10116 RepID=A6HJ79_RAT|nr:Coenzyme A synthase, isoform CRA_b [Rattus norvegicus]
MSHSARWKRLGIFYRNASPRLTRPGTDSGFSVAPHWPLELTNLMVRRNGGLDVYPMSGLRGFKLSCAGHREKLGSRPSMLEFGQQ